MKKKYKIIMITVQVILFLLVLIFLNDKVSANTSDKLAPFFIMLMLINMLVGIILHKNDKKQ